MSLAFLYFCINDKVKINVKVNYRKENKHNFSNEKKRKKRQGRRLTIASTPLYGEIVLIYLSRAALSILIFPVRS